MNNERKSELVSRRMALFAAIAAASAVAVPATALLASDDAEAATAGMTRRQSRRSARRTGRAARRAARRGATPAGATPAPK